MKETKQERFKRLAEARVNKILKMFKLLGNCSFKGTYEYTEEQVEKVFQRLQTEFNRTFQRFNTQGTGRFTLSDDPEPEHEFPSVYLTLPDGSILKAVAVDDKFFPAVDIWLQPPDGEDEKSVCFVEYNTERESGKELCIGVCNSDSEDPYFYESFYKDKSSRGGL